MSSQSDVTSVTRLDHHTGRVKWFNNKAGYGFITVTSGERAGSDIFVHHSSIGVANQQYKYLVQGEYVDFDLVATQSGNHEYQAHSVNGINGGKLMCETRREFKIARNNYKVNSRPLDTVQESQTENVEVSPVVQKKTAPRARGEGPRDSEQQGWKVVEKPSAKSAKPRGRPPRSTVAKEN